MFRDICSAPCAGDACFPEAPRALSIGPHWSCTYLSQASWTAATLLRAQLHCIWTMRTGLGMITWDQALCRSCCATQRIYMASC